MDGPCGHPCGLAHLLAFCFSLFYRRRRVNRRLWSVVNGHGAFRQGEDTGHRNQDPGHRTGKPEQSSMYCTWQSPSSIKNAWSGSGDQEHRIHARRRTTPLLQRASIPADVRHPEWRLQPASNRISAMVCSPAPLDNASNKTWF